MGHARDFDLVELWYGDMSAFAFAAFVVDILGAAVMDLSTLHGMASRTGGESGVVFTVVVSSATL